MKVLRFGDAAIINPASIRVYTTSFRIDLTTSTGAEARMVLSAAVDTTPYASNIIIAATMRLYENILEYLANDISYYFDVHKQFTFLLQDTVAKNA